MNPSKQESKDVMIGILKEGQGRLYYRLAYEAALINPYNPPLDRGFCVVRTYEATDDPKDLIVKKNENYTEVIVKAGSRITINLSITNTSYKFYVAVVDHLPGGLESIGKSNSTKRGYYSRDVWNHFNLRDDRTEIYADTLYSGVHTFSYTTRATAIGTFIVPPVKAEEMYSPEVFGRSDVIRFVISETMPTVVLKK